MIERKIIQDKLNEFLVGSYIGESLDRVGYSHTQVQKTPLGEKIIIHCSRPGLVVGAKGSNIKKMTKQLKAKFKFENPQIEIEEVANQNTSAALIAEYIANSLERFGAGGFKGVGYRAMDQAINSGALGIEILISGKIPSSRAKVWRFYMGYLKKCGDVAFSGVDVAYNVAKLKTGVVGLQVRVMPPNLVLPDRIKVNKEELVIEEESRDQTKEEAKEVEKKAEEKKAEAKPTKEKKPAKKKAAKKTTPKADTKQEKPEAKAEEVVEQKAEAKQE